MSLPIDVNIGSIFVRCPNCGESVTATTGLCPDNKMLIYGNPIRRKITGVIRLDDRCPYCNKFLKISVADGIYLSASEDPATYKEVPGEATLYKLVKIRRKNAQTA